MSRAYDLVILSARDAHTVAIVVCIFLCWFTRAHATRSLRGKDVKMTELHKRLVHIDGLLWQDRAKVVRMGSEITSVRRRVADLEEKNIASVSHFSLDSAD